MPTTIIHSHLNTHPQTHAHLHTFSSFIIHSFHLSPIDLLTYSTYKQSTMNHQTNQHIHLNENKVRSMEKERTQMKVERERETKGTNRNSRWRKKKKQQHTNKQIEQTSHIQPSQHITDTQSIGSTDSSHHAHLIKASASNISSDELLSIYAYCTFRSLINAHQTCKWWYHIASKEKSRQLTYVIKKDVPLSHIFPSSTSPLLHHITHVETTDTIPVARLFELSTYLPFVEVIDLGLHQSRRSSVSLSNFTYPHIYTRSNSDSTIGNPMRLQQSN